MQADKPSNNSRCANPFPPTMGKSGSSDSPQHQEKTKSYKDKSKAFFQKFIWRWITHAVRLANDNNGLVTALATVAIAALTWSISEDSKQQAKIARDQFKVMQGQLDAMEADRRPWVSAKPVLDGIVWNKLGANVQYHLELTNSGHEAGLNMMVSTDVIPFSLTPGSVGAIDWVRKVSDNFKNSKMIKHIGPPILPNSIVNLVREKTIEREEIEAFNKKVGSDGSAIGPYLMPINLAYVVNYFSPNGTPHQTYCWAEINRINQDDPFSIFHPGIQVEVNVPGSALQLRNFGINCGAD
jgi:hypothetical protein